MTDRATLEAAEIASRHLAKTIDGRLPPGWCFILILASDDRGDRRRRPHMLSYVSNIQVDSAYRIVEEYQERMRERVENGAPKDRTEPECWSCGGKKDLNVFAGAIRATLLCQQCLGQGVPLAR